MLQSLQKNLKSGAPRADSTAVPAIKSSKAQEPAPAGASTSAGQAVEAMAGYFCCLADTFGIPRSVALLYHTLFVAERPICFNEISELSGLSKGSTSTGLRTLQRMRAVEVVFVPNDRNTYYRAELSLRRVAAAFFQESLLPGIKAGGRLLDAAPPADDSSLPATVQTRLSSLRTWHQASLGLVPMLAALGELDTAG